MATLMPMFLKYPSEAATIGRILSSYGELEVHLGLCLGAATGSDLDALKVVFRDIGEQRRVRTANKRLKPICRAVGLEAECKQAIQAMDYSRTIRNTLSHCQWAYQQGLGCWYGSLFLGAQDTGTGYRLDMFHVDQAILDGLEDYMSSTFDSLCHLAGELRVKRGRVGNNPFPRVADFPRPPLHNPVADHPCPSHLVPGFNG